MNAAPEMIDILDNTGTKSGRVATRDDIHRLGLGHKIAAVAVIDDKNRILLQQRSMNKLTNPGKWDIAAAGHVDAGEDTFTTALRETAEEVGLKVGGVHFLMSYSDVSTYNWHGEQMTDRQFYDCFVARVPEINTENLTLQKSEVQATKLVDVAEFKNMIEAGQIVNRQPFYDAIIDYITYNNIRLEQI